MPQKRNTFFCKFKSIKILAATLILLIVQEFPLFSQDDENYDAADSQRDTIETNKPRFGVFGSYGPNLFHGDFYKLPGTWSCCEKFGDGDGWGFTAGALFDMPLANPKFRLGARAGYSTMDALTTKSDAVNIIVNGASQSLPIEHRLDAKFSLVSLDLLASYNFWNHFNVNLGPKFGYILSSKYSQIEKITGSSQFVFDDTGLPYRNYFHGDEIRDLKKFQFFLTGGLSYDIPLNRKQFIFLTPEVNYTFPLTNLVSGITWKASMLRGGLALKMQTPPPPPPKPEAPILAPMPELPEPTLPPAISADVTAVQTDSLGKEQPEVSIRIEDFTSHDMHPMLNFVFFDSCSATIPERYKLSTKETAGKFSEDSLKGFDAIKTYYHVLDIIGSRMNKYPSAELTLTGTNCNSGGEVKNKELSQHRAETVRDYFVNVWGISADRINIKARNLPDEPSNVTLPGGDDENRRVEIVSNSMEISEPVFSLDTIRQVPESKITFTPSVKSDAGVDKWNLSITQNAKVIKTFEGSGEVPEKFEWTITTDEGNLLAEGNNLAYSFTATDKIGQSYTTSEKVIPISRLTIDQKRTSGIQDKEYETYSMILFDYGQSKLKVAHKKTADFIKDRLSDNSSVKIIGYTDSMGASDVNKKISLERAKAVAKRMEFKNAVVEGKGGEALLYPTDLPEQRFYCRTVVIYIETQVDNQ